MQSKLNQGDLCKICIKLKSEDIYVVKDDCSDNENSFNDTSNSDDIFPNITLQERGVIDLIKERMVIEQQQQQEYIELLRNQIEYLKKDIDFFKKDIAHKNVIIENLICDDRKPRKELNTDLNDVWKLVKGDTVSKTQIMNKSNFNIPLQNRFSEIPVDECIVNDDNSHGTYTPINHLKSTTNKSDKSRIYINKNPERNFLPLRNVAKPIHNTKYVASTRKQRQIAIISDSITKPIDMNKFNDVIDNGSCVKRAYGGATASQLNY